MRRIISWIAFLSIISVVFVARWPASLETRTALAAPLGRVGPQAVWKPAPQLIANIRAKCGADPQHTAECFLREMGAAGASAEAVAFSKSLPDPGGAYLRGFRDTGRVDIAYVEYFLRANETEGVFLVNGDPPIIDVDDAKYLSTDQLRMNSDYATLLRKFPNLSLWPSDRYHMQTPAAVSVAHGQKFDVEYLLQDGCHACARVGVADVAFLFDDSGRFQNTRVLRVLPQRGQP